MKPEPASAAHHPAASATPAFTDASQLFNPDAPFSLHTSDVHPADVAPAVAQDDPFFLPGPVAQSSPAPKPAAKSAFPRPALKISRKAVLATLALVVLAGGGAFATRYMNSASTAGPATGTLVVQSNPAGVPVFVDGKDYGQTPARFSVPVGPHILELRGRGVPRVMNVNVTAGAEISQYLEFANTPETGSLRVETQPAGAKVLVDGTDRGVAPVTVTDLLPGDHEVILQTPLASARHVVNVQAGGTASIVTPVASAATTAGPVSGWLTVKAPFSLEIREEGRIIGTTDADRVMLAAGKHDLELVNETLGYRSTRSVQGTARESRQPRHRPAEGHRQSQRHAVGRSLGRWSARRRDADRQPVDSDRFARSGVPPSAVRREAPRDLGHGRRADTSQRRHEVGLCCSFCEGKPVLTFLTILTMVMVTTLAFTLNADPQAAPVRAVRRGVRIRVKR